MAVCFAGYSLPVLGAYALAHAGGVVRQSYLPGMPCCRMKLSHSCSFLRTLVRDPISLPGRWRSKKFCTMTDSLEDRNNEQKCLCRRTHMEGVRSLNSRW